MAFWELNPMVQHRHNERWAHDTTLHDTTRHDMTRHDTTRHDTTRHNTTRHDTHLPSTQSIPLKSGSVLFSNFLQIL
jgi:hypothetical protein